MRSKLAVFAVVSVLALPVMARTRAVRQITGVWLQPQCTQISGLNWVRFIDPTGAVRGNPQEPQGAVFTPINTTDALSTGATANVMWAVTADGQIYQSADAGCSWAFRAAVPETQDHYTEPRVLARHATRVYVYTDERIVRLTMGTVETFTLPEAIRNVEVDPLNELHLRAIALHGAVYESTDGAATWAPVGRTTLNVVMSVATDPKNFSHLIAGVGNGCTRVFCSTGKMVASVDGGKTWTPSGLANAVVNDIEFSPADALVVWADAYPINGTGSGLYRSTDGGQTFQYVAGSTSNPFSWGPLAPHPTNPDLVAVANRGAAIYGPQGRISSVWEENVKNVTWSPAGTLYYLSLVVQLV